MGPVWFLLQLQTCGDNGARPVSCREVDAEEDQPRHEHQFAGAKNLSDDAGVCNAEEIEEELSDPVDRSHEQQDAHQIWTPPRPDHQVADRTHLTAPEDVAEHEY